MFLFVPFYTLNYSLQIFPNATNVDREIIKNFEEPPVVSIPDILASADSAKLVSVEGKILKVNLLTKQC